MRNTFMHRAIKELLLATLVVALAAELALAQSAKDILHGIERIQLGLKKR